MAHPYRADHVGSLLRPPDLVHARQDFNEGRISGDQLREVEDRAVLQALDLQRQVGIDIYTEGEYRRSGWSNAVRESVEGLVPVEGSPRNTAEMENLAVASQCGFASTFLGNLLTWDEQRRKLELVVETARKVWA